MTCALDRFDVEARQRRRDRVDDRSEKGRGSGALGQERRPVEPPQLIEIESLRIRVARLVQEGRRFLMNTSRSSAVSSSSYAPGRRTTVSTNSVALPSP